jgi:hypothetical protein
MTTQQTGQEGFRWWLGIVEDINDPMKLGRAKVRVLNEHDDIDTGDLDWAHVMMPNTSACVDGVGDSPNLAVGSRVVGFYLDGEEKQQPMILGSFPTIPGNNTDRHSLNWLHRGQNIVTKEVIGPEPPAAYAAQYPYNRTITTKAGHVIELDDTPQNERVHIFHNSGTYIEINNEGRLVIKTIADGFDIVGGNKEVYIKGNCNVKVDGSCTMHSKDTTKISSDKGITMKAPGGVTVVGGSLTVEETMAAVTGATGSFSTPSGNRINVQNGIVTSLGQ